MTIEKLRSQGSLTTSYSRAVFEKEIDTLAELDRSGLPIIASADTVRTLFSHNETRVMSSLRSKLKGGDFAVLYEAAYNRNMCGIERLSDVNIIIKVTKLQVYKLYIIKFIITDFRLH